MISAILILTTMGLILGALLGYAAKLFHVEGDPLVEEVSQLMPGTQCGQCGFAGCTPAAEAIVSGAASVTCCPPGGKQLAETLAGKLNVSIDLDAMNDAPVFAQINASQCTGCTRCFKVCPTDAIMGANKQIHVVMSDACTGCGSCHKACPENCIAMQPALETLDTWNWPKPISA
jgi:electron transport complex protein RnfB